ncbi:MAG: hypothetical protein RIC52_18585, partial [Amphiplicatus sp.]
LKQCLIPFLLQDITVETVQGAQFLAADDCPGRRLTLLRRTKARPTTAASLPEGRPSFGDSGVWLV